MLLTRLDAAPDTELSQIIAENRGVFEPLDGLEGMQPYLIRQVVAARLRDELVIDEHYKKVDGTSFAAPIVSSIVAQMLEANPGLAPGEVKRILMRTAARLPGIELERQGWGVAEAGGRRRGSAPGPMSPRRYSARITSAGSTMRHVLLQPSGVLRDGRRPADLRFEEGARSALPPECRVLREHL